MSYLDVRKIKELKVEHIGNSSHCLTNLETTLSKFSTTIVFQESFDSTKRW